MSSLAHNIIPAHGHSGGWYVPEILLEFGADARQEFVQIQSATGVVFPRDGGSPKII
jgi:hypothetical protein